MIFLCLHLSIPTDSGNSHGSSECSPAQTNTWSPPPPPQVVNTQNSTEQPSAPPPSHQQIDSLDQYNPQSLSHLQQSLPHTQQGLNTLPPNMANSRPQQPPQDYIDYSSYQSTPLYSHSYSYDPSYLTAHHLNMTSSGAGGYMGLHHHSAAAHQQQQQHNPVMESVNGGYYTPLDQYSRVQSVGDIKMATSQFEATRHGVSMSQPDLSSATWPTPPTEETKYQVL